MGRRFRISHLLELVVGRRELESSGNTRSRPCTGRSSRNPSERCGRICRSSSPRAEMGRSAPAPPAPPPWRKPAQREGSAPAPPPSSCSARMGWVALTRRGRGELGAAVALAGSAGGQRGWERAAPVKKKDGVVGCGGEERAPGGRSSRAGEKRWEQGRG
jgi:hypothetical protein